MIDDQSSYLFDKPRLTSFNRQSKTGMEGQVRISLFDKLTFYPTTRREMMETLNSFLRFKGQLSLEKFNCPLKNFPWKIFNDI